MLVLGASHAGHPSDPFTVAPRQATDRGPWGGVLTPVRPATAPGAGTSTTAPALSTTTTTTTTAGAERPGREDPHLPVGVFNGDVKCGCGWDVTAAR